MKKVISLVLAVSLIVCTFVSCSPKINDNPKSSDVISLSSSTDKYAEWLKEKLEIIPDKLVLGIGNNDEYNVNMTYFEDDGYVIKKVKDSVVLFGKTETGLDLACQKYADFIDKSGYAEEFVYNELSKDYMTFAQAATSNTADDNLTLAFKTDTHHTNGRPLNDFVDFAKLQKYVPIDLYVHGGDLINGDHGTENIATDLLRESISAMNAPDSVPFVSLRGNHDDNSWAYHKASGNQYGIFPEDGIISSDEWREVAFTNSSAIVMDEEGSYGYMDHEASKIRVLFVDTSDLPYEPDENGMYYYGAYTGHAIRDRQLNFMAEAMSFNDKGDDAQNWAILIVSHVPIETMKNNEPYRFGGKEAAGRNFYIFLRILEAYKNGTDIEIIQTETTHAGSGGFNTGDIKGDFACNVKAEFSKNGPGEFIGFICGHTHCDNYSDSVGYGSYSNDYNKIYPELSLGYSYISVSSNGFSVITIDRNGDGTGEIHVDKYGTSVVTKQAPIADGDKAQLSTDPVVVSIYTSTPAAGSIASGNYTVKYSQPEKRK